MPTYNSFRHFWLNDSQRILKLSPSDLQVNELINIRLGYTFFFLPLFLSFKAVAFNCSGSW